MEFVPGHYWMKKPNYTLDRRLTNQRYTDLNSALIQCVSKLKMCQGVVQEGAHDFYMYKDTKLSYEQGHTTYLMADDELIVTTMTLSSNGVSWTYQNPFTLTGEYGGWYSNKDDCLRNCGRKKLIYFSIFNDDVVN